MSPVKSFLLLSWVSIASFSAVVNVKAAENRHETLRYSCSTQLAEESHYLEVYHDGAGGWGAPSSGRGTVLLKREGIGTSDQRLIHEVYLRSSASGSDCGLVAQFTEGDDIRFANFVLEIREPCGRLKNTVEGTLQVMFYLEETETGKREAPVVCQIH